MYGYEDRYYDDVRDEYLTKDELFERFNKSLDGESEPVQVYLEGVIDIDLTAAEFLRQYHPTLYTGAWHAYRDRHPYVEAANVPRWAYQDPDAMRDAKLNL